MSRDDRSAAARRCLESPGLRRGIATSTKGVPMSRYAVVHIDDIPEQDDGQVPMRSVRHHLGITGFGVNAWTARNAGDRIIPEHQEANETEESSDRDEERYLAVRGRAPFELDGERNDEPAGTFPLGRPR